MDESEDPHYSVLPNTAGFTVTHASPGYAERWSKIARANHGRSEVVQVGETSTREAAPGVLRIPGGNGSGPDEPAPAEELKESLRRLLATVLDRAFGIALDGVEGLARWLDTVATRGGFRMNALIGGAQAVVGGGNPLWGALVGGLRALSPGARGALVAALVLAVLLLPVTVVLLLLVLIVVAIVGAARAAS